jgi:hypothetical protein
VRLGSDSVVPHVIIRSPGSFDRICSIASIMPRIASGRVTDGFHGPCVDGFDLIGLESDTVTADRFRTKGSRGSDPRLLRPNNGPATRPHIGERPRASRIVQALGLDQPSTNTITQQDRQLKRLDPYGLGDQTPAGDDIPLGRRCAFAEVFLGVNRAVSGALRM